MIFYCQEIEIGTNATKSYSFQIRMINFNLEFEEIICVTSRYGIWVFEWVDLSEAVEEMQYYVRKKLTGQNILQHLTGRIGRINWFKPIESSSSRPKRHYLYSVSRHFLF